MRPTRIVSGGQTGADRGGLDAALELGIPHGGWCPRGRLAEDGAIPARYALEETTSAEYPVRTDRNARDSDGTVLFTFGEPEGGSAYTIECARRHGRPLLHVDLDGGADAAVTSVVAWLRGRSIATLNVAGSRESRAPGIAALVRSVIVRALSEDLAGGEQRELFRDPS